MAHAVSIKSTKWSQICNDESLKDALSQSASQIYTPKTKTPTRRDSNQARYSYRSRLDDELQNPIIEQFRCILLDIKVVFLKETKKRSIADTQLSKVSNYPSKLRVNVGNNVQLLDVICNESPRNDKDNSEAVVSISFGSKVSDDICINQHSNRFVISLMKQHRISGDLLDEYTLTGRQDCDDTDQLFYSQVIVDISP